MDGNISGLLFLFHLSQCLSGVLAMNGALSSCCLCFVVSSIYFLTSLTRFGEIEPMSCPGLYSLGLCFLKERENSAIHWRLFIIIVVIIILIVIIIIALRSLQTLFDVLLSIF